MKINIKSLTILALMAHMSLFAIVDNVLSWSAAYVRSGTRNAATDAADAAVYNQAGTAFMKDGFHLEMGNQVLLKEYSHKANTVKYTDNTPVYLFPNLNLVYKQNRIAVFGAMNVVGGGGTVEYDSGSVTTAPLSGGGFKNKASASSIYLGYNAGGAYQVMDNLSIGGAVRYVTGEQSVKVTGKNSLQTVSPLLPDTKEYLTEEASAAYYGGIVSINYSPIPELLLAVRYEGVTYLKWTVDKSVNNLGFAGLVKNKGYEYVRELPALLAVGVAYDITSALRAEFNLNYA
ncbi:MAG: hypothetical protein EOM18_17245, partial [Clostridia bacterium]|nr:hypothetical protein [Clostridia bacterium]